MSSRRWLRENHKQHLLTGAAPEKKLGAPSCELSLTWRVQLAGFPYPSVIPPPNHASLCLPASLSLTYMFIYEHMRVHVCTQMPVGICVRLCVCVYAYIHRCVHTCRFTCVLCMRVYSSSPLEGELGLLLDSRTVGGKLVQQDERNTAGT